MLLGCYKCPAVLMYLDFVALTAPMKVLKEKVLFFHYLATLPETSLANRMLTIQEKFNFPSIKDEVSGFLARHSIHDVT